MKPHHLMIAAALGLLAITGPARAATVGEWMEVSAEIRRDWFERTVDNARPDAVVALAMFEAANAIEARHLSYLGFERSEAALPVKVAVDSAAATALRLLYPVQAEAIDARLDRAKESWPEGEATSAAVAVGERAARAALARGVERLGTAPSAFRTHAPTGIYVPTETVSAISDFDLVLAPWALGAVDAARPEAPPSLSSEEYIQALGEVREYGAKTGSRRTPEQTETALFWFFIDMNPVMADIAQTPGRTAADNARMYAMFYMATDDSWIASADAKAHYQFWRPITAIRQSDRDPSDATAPVFDWAPLLPTPPHPEYPCAHCVQASAQAVVLLGEIDDPEREFTVSSSTIPEAAPRLVTLADYVYQTSLSRIYAGAHYRFSNEVGEAVGRKVGQVVIDRWSTTPVTP